MIRRREVPGDIRIEEKEKDQIEKYQDLGRELQKIRNVKLKIISLVVGSLKAKAIGCGSISTVFSSIVLLCVSYIIIMMMIIIIIVIIIIIIITIIGNFGTK